MPSVGPIYATAATATTGTWTTPTNAIGSTAATFASWTSTTRSATATLTLSGYTFTGTASTDTVNSVSATIKHYETATTISGATVQLQDSTGVAIGAAVALTLSATTTNSQTVSFATLPTAAQVAGGLRLAITFTHNSTTTTGTGNVDYASISVVTTAAAPKPKIETLKFDPDGTTSSSQWTYEPNASLSGGNLTLTISATYQGLTSKPAVDFTGSAVWVQVVQVGNTGNGGVDTEWGIRAYGVDSGSTARFVVENGVLFMQGKDATNTVVAGTSITYDPVAHAWWRIRDVGGNSLFWETSPDGLTWTVRSNWDTTPLDFTNLQIRFDVGTWNADPNPGTAVFANLNTVPTGITPATVPGVAGTATSTAPAGAVAAARVAAVLGVAGTATSTAPAGAVAAARVATVLGAAGAATATAAPGTVAAARVATVLGAAGAATATAAPGVPVAGSSSTAPIDTQPNWQLVFTENFQTPAELGQFAAAYPGWAGYDGYRDTSRNMGRPLVQQGVYDSATTTRVHNGLLDINVFTDPGGTPHVMAVTPPPTATGQLYGRYAVRFRADPVPGYKVAWLLWPFSENWSEGEVDFPEGNLDGTIQGYSHDVTGTPSSNAWSIETGLPMTDWHTAVIEWTPSELRYILDGVVRSTTDPKAIPTHPMRWVLQTETLVSATAPPPGANGHVYIDWVAAWSYVPGATATGSATAPSGTVLAARSGQVTGIAATAGALAPAGTVSAARTAAVTGITATASSSAGIGSATGSANIPGSTADAAVAAVAGIVAGAQSARVAGATALATAKGVAGRSPVRPSGPQGDWDLAFSDEFTGTTLQLPWVPGSWTDGQSGVTLSPANVSVTGGRLTITAPSASSGARVSTSPEEGAPASGWLLPVGGFAEARIFTQGNGTQLYGWPAWWTSGANWPAAGEHDMLEVLGGSATVNYHSPSGSHNGGAVPGYWGDAWHTIGVHRKPGSADVYYDGVLVKSYPTDDDGTPQALLLSIGGSSGGPDKFPSTLQAEYVRVFTQPVGSAWVTGTTAKGTATGGVGRPKLETLVDGFDGTSLDSATWTNNGGSLVTVGNGALRISPDTSYPSVASVSQLDLRNSSISWQILQLVLWANGAHSYESQVSLTTPAGDKLACLVLQSPNPWTGARIQQAGQASSDPWGANAPNGVQWWQIREANGVVTWSWSVDGQTWTDVYSTPTPFDVSRVQVSISAGHWDTTELVGTQAYLFGGVNSQALSVPAGVVGVAATGTAVATAGTASASGRVFGVPATGTTAVAAGISAAAAGVVGVAASGAAAASSGTVQAGQSIFITGAAATASSSASAGAPHAAALLGGAIASATAVAPAGAAQGVDGSVAVLLPGNAATATAVGGAGAVSAGQRTTGATATVAAAAVGGTAQAARVAVVSGVTAGATGSTAAGAPRAALILFGTGATTTADSVPGEPVAAARIGGNLAFATARAPLGTLLAAAAVEGATSLATALARAGVAVAVQPHISYDYVVAVLDSDGISSVELDGDGISSVVLDPAAEGTVALDPFVEGAVALADDGASTIVLLGTDEGTVILDSDGVSTATVLIS